MKYKKSYVKYSCIYKEKKSGESMELVEAIIRYRGDILAVAQDANVTIEVLDSNYAIVTIRVDQIQSLYAYPEVLFIELAKTVTYQLRAESINNCMQQMEQQNRITGRQIIVGIIDSGIDYTHPDFCNADGTSRILYFWDQTGTNNPPKEFTIGTEYTNQQLNEALRATDPFSLIPSLDQVGHGTAVTGIACGNGSSSQGQQRGIAPEATIIGVRLGTSDPDSNIKTTSIMRALQYILTRAMEANMPVAINISFGTNNGAHNGFSLFESYMNDASLQWKSVIVVATGNEGAKGQHYYGELQQGQTQTVEFTITQNLTAIEITLWKDYVDDFSFTLIAPGGQITKTVSQANTTVTTMLQDTTITIHYGMPSHYDILQEVTITFHSPTSIVEGIWQLQVTGNTIYHGVFNAWLPTFAQVGSTAFLRPSPETTMTLPSTARNVISVGAYDTVTGTLAAFSGAGYTSDIVYIKPDLVAPGVSINTTQMGGGYGIYSGTSVAAPFVCGASALLLQWGIVEKNDVMLYGEKIKGILRKGATRSPLLSYPNGQWGYGIFCMQGALDVANAYRQASDQG